MHSRHAATAWLAGSSLPAVSTAMGHLQVSHKLESSGVGLGLLSLRQPTTDIHVAATNLQYCCCS
jgi:hypothetical protein